MKSLRKRDFKMREKWKKTRGSDVREIKGEENFKKGVIIKKKKSQRGHAYGIWLLGYLLIMEKAKKHEIVDGEYEEESESFSESENDWKLKKQSIS